MKKTFVAIFSAAAMVVSCLGGTSAYAASVYTDINDVPWSGAATYIERAYELGLMEGYVENNLRYCKAKNNITYCEATQLMYALMSSYSGTSVSDTVVTEWSTVMQSNNIPSWAYNAVSYALENSILSQTDISIFMSSSSTQNNARREDVAVIFGKALAKIYSLSSDTTLSYNDASSIANTSVPYVELLNRLGIMVGDSDNNFNPKVNINRAEMSVLVVNTYDVLNGNSSSTTTTTTTTTPTGTVTQYAGTITEMTSSGSGYSITVSNNGTTNSFTTTSSTAVTGDSTTTAVSGLSTGDSIVAVCYSGVATTIVLLSTGSSTSSVSSTVKGNLSNVSTSSIAVKTSSSTKTYSISSSSIDVTIDGSTSSLSTLVSRFNGGYNYTVTVSLDSSSNVVGITATTGSSDSDYDDDAIMKLTSSKVTLNDGTVLYFPDDEDDVTIKLDGSTVDYDDLKDAFDDLDDDEQLVVSDYSLNSDDELKKLTVTTEDLDTSSSSDDTEGVISKITSSKITLASGSSYKFADDDDITKLKFDGDSYDGDETDDFADDINEAIDDGDSVYVELTLDDDDYIIKAVATICDSDDGDITGITSSKITFDSKKYSYSSSTISVSVTDGNSTISTISKLKTAVETDGKTIDATVVFDDDDEIIAITGYVSEIEDAEISSFTYKSSNDIDENYIKLDNNASSVKYYFSDDYFTKSEISDLYDDYKDGDEDVDLELDDDGKIVDITLS